MYINLGIHLMGILMTALHIVYATHVVNIVRYIKVDNFTVHTIWETGGVYNQLDIVQRRSYDKNIGGSLSMLDPDERGFPYPKGLQSVRFAVPLLLLALAISRISYSKKRSG